MRTSQTRSPARPASLARLLLLAAVVALPLAGCKKSDSLVTGTIYPDDYRQRHPIALVNAPTNLDVFAGRNMAGLDPRQAEDVRAFARDYRQHGSGPMQMFVPVHTLSPSAAHRGAQAVRGQLAASGIGAAHVRVTSYAGSGDDLASPVRLSFVKLQAKVSTQCGDWSQDIGGIAATTEGWQNKPYRNLGCSYQNMLAQQVADPLDLQRGRVEDRSDVMRRMKVFEDARKANDPSTNWKTGSATVKAQ